MSKFMKIALGAALMSGAYVGAANATYLPVAGDVVSFDVTTVNGSLSGNLIYGAGGTLVADNVYLNETQNAVTAASLTVSGSSFNNQSVGQASNSNKFTFPGTVTFDTTPTVAYGASSLVLTEIVNLGSYVKSVSGQNVTYTVQGEYLITLGFVAPLGYNTNSVDPNFVDANDDNVSTSFIVTSNGTPPVVGHPSTALVQDQVLDGTSTISVPEPASLAVVGMGVAGLLGARRRRRA